MQCSDSVLGVLDRGPRLGGIEWLALGRALVCMGREGEKMEEEGKPSSSSGWCRRRPRCGVARPCQQLGAKPCQCGQTKPSQINAWCAPGPVRVRVAGGREVIWICRGEAVTKPVSRGRSGPTGLPRMPDRDEAHVSITFLPTLLAAICIVMIINKLTLHYLPYPSSSQSIIRSSRRLESSCKSNRSQL